MKKEKLDRSRFDIKVKSDGREVPDEEWFSLLINLNYFLMDHYKGISAYLEDLDEK